VIGSYGDVVFEVSSDVVKTFEDLQFQHKVRYAQHDVHGGTGLIELTGRDPSTGSLKIRLDTALGVDPMKELAALYIMMRDGVVTDLIFDGQPQGEGMWVIESVSETWKIVNNTGALIVAEASVQFKEYIGGGPYNV
jgi:phage protein U